MQALCTAQKKKGAACPAQEFDAAFYQPFEAAAGAALSLLCSARAELLHMLGADCVRAITFRLKSPSSIREKLIRKKLPAHAAAACAVLHDVAGLRVVLTSVDAVYRYAGIIRRSAAECAVLHDYIASPKPSGYRSLHLLLRIPVCAGGCTRMLPVELQLRTVPMDIWASIEHEIAYKPIRPLLR